MVPIGAPVTIGGLGLRTLRRRQYRRPHRRRHCAAEHLERHAGLRQNRSRRARGFHRRHTITLERIVGSSVVATSGSFFVEIPTISTMSPGFRLRRDRRLDHGLRLRALRGRRDPLASSERHDRAAGGLERHEHRVDRPRGFSPTGPTPSSVQLSPADGGSVVSASAAFTVGTGMGTQSFATLATSARRPPGLVLRRRHEPARDSGQPHPTPSQAAVTVLLGRAPPRTPS